MASPEEAPAADVAVVAERLPDPDAALVERMRAGDEDAFTTLVGRYHASLVNLAMDYVPSRVVAEDVAQDAWIGVLRGIGRFEGRSTFRTWLFRILVNTARTRGQREARSIPFSSAFPVADGEDAPLLPPERFRPESEDGGGHWWDPPREWAVSPEREALSVELRGRIEDAIASLPERQRQVIRLRDIEGWTADEVRNAMDLGETNQRVLLHRARTKVRRALEEYFDGR